MTNYHLNQEQQDLVRNNLSVINMVIAKHIVINEDVQGMGYDDIYQVAAIALCKAAATYKNKALFSTYAFTVIRNAIYDSLRHAVQINSHQCYIDSEQGGQYKYISNELMVDEIVSNKMIIEALRASKKNYRGIALKGIEAIELKVKGYSSSDIAKMYAVKTNHVEAWISRVTKYLKQDQEFLRMIT